MPLTFIDIERQKNWRIALFFIVLLLIYLAVVLLIGAMFLDVPLFSAPRFLSFAAIASLVAAGVHFWFSASNAVSSIIRTLDARPPDPADEVHRVLLNIIEEVHVVTGRKLTITPYVIPSFSLNALAATDLKGKALVAITEGLLSRLSRSQLEAVVAHETHHILSGDCLETTMAASLFGTLSASLDQARRLSQNRVFMLPAFIAAWLLFQTGYLLNLFISREREYRADAAAVRMTRNPLALAETFHLLSRSWRGAGFIGSALQMLCIVNPVATSLDESEGLWSDLFSTHPPLRKRMFLMLKMARVSVTELDRRARMRTADATEQPTTGYYAMSPHQEWQGPLTPAEIAVLPWLTPLTWIVQPGRTEVERAWKDPSLEALFLLRLSGKEVAETSGLNCPTCRQPLHTAPYAGTQVSQCPFCAGTLVENDRIPRIIARAGRSRRCTERINALARAAVQQNLAGGLRRAHQRTGPAAPPGIQCPKCANPMLRGFYSLSHLVEVDRCSHCGLTWFDQNELEMLQCMVENRLVARLPEDEVTRLIGRDAG
jgi:heat shock protein HtpX